MSPENSKPEWFQLADADAPLPRPNGKRALRIMALATPLLVLGAGLIFAQTQESPIAVASAVTSASSTATHPIALSSTPSPITGPARASAPAPASASQAVQISQVKPASTIQSAAITQSVAITSKQPAIATMPTGGGEDEGSRDSDDD